MSSGPWFKILIIKLDWKKGIDIPRKILHEIRGNVNECKPRHLCGGLRKMTHNYLWGFPVKVWTLYNTYKSTCLECFQTSEKGLLRTLNDEVDGDSENHF